MRPFIPSTVTPGRDIHRPRRGVRPTSLSLKARPGHPSAPPIQRKSGQDMKSDPLRSRGPRRAPLAARGYHDRGDDDRGDDDRGYDDRAYHSPYRRAPLGRAYRRCAPAQADARRTDPAAGQRHTAAKRPTAHDRALRRPGRAPDRSGSDPRRAHRVSRGPTRGVRRRRILLGTAVFTSWCLTAARPVLHLNANLHSDDLYAGRRGDAGKRKADPAGRVPAEHPRDRLRQPGTASSTLQDRRRLRRRAAPMPRQMVVHGRRRSNATG